MMADRLWTAYCNEDGEPWAIFIDGHVDLTPLRTTEARAEMAEAFKLVGGDDDHGWFEHELNVGHYWIRDSTKDDDPELEYGDVEYPYQFCEAGDADAMPISGVKF